MTRKKMGLSLVKVVPAYMSGRLAWLIIMRSGAWRERAILVSEFRRAVVGATFSYLSAVVIRLRTWTPSCSHMWAWLIIYRSLSRKKLFFLTNEMAGNYINTTEIKI